MSPQKPKKTVKIVAGTLALAFFLQILPASRVFGEEPETQASENIELNPDFQPKPSDLEFSERSQTGKRWFFKDFPRDLGGSLKQSFWGWGGLAFGLGAGLTAALHPLDGDINNDLTENEIFGSTTNDIVNIGLAPYVYGGVSVLLWISGYASKHPKLELTGKALSESLLLSMAITFIGKLAFRRERPNGGNFSFPSGHATAAFSTAGVLTVFYGWKAALPSYALASFISVSRIDSKSHFLSDVVMGAVIGSVIGIGTGMYHKKKNQNFFITPEVGRDHASINFHYFF